MANPEGSVTLRSLLRGHASYSPNPLTACNAGKPLASGTLKQPPNLEYNASRQSTILKTKTEPTYQSSMTLREEANHVKKSISIQSHLVTSQKETLPTPELLTP